MLLGAAVADRTGRVARVDGAGPRPRRWRPTPSPCTRSVSPTSFGAGAVPPLSSAATWVIVRPFRADVRAGSASESSPRLKSSVPCTVILVEVNDEER